MNLKSLKYFLAIITLLPIWDSSPAQVRFQKTFGGSSSDKANAVVEIPGIGYTVMGITGSFGVTGIYCLKLDKSGDTLWTKVLEQPTTGISNFVLNTDGTYTVSGSTDNFGQGGTEIYLMKLDSTANAIWTKSYGGTSHDFGNSVEITMDGGYLISGRTQSFGVGLASSYIIKSDINGDTLWTRVAGGSGLDGANWATNTQNDNIIVVGQTKSFGAGEFDAYVLKLNNNGDTVWTKTFGGNADDIASIVKITNDNGLIILGTTGIPSSGGIYMIRLNNIGDTLWTKHYGGTCGDGPKSINVTDDNGFIIAGTTCGFGAAFWDAYLLRLDSTGEVMWSRTYKWNNNLENIFNDVKQTADGGFIAVGTTGNITSTTNDVYVVKTDANGNSGCGDSLVLFPSGNLNTIVSSTSTVISSGGVVDSTSMSTSGVNTLVSTMCIDSIVGINQPSQLTLDHYVQVSPNPFHDYATIEAYIPDETTSGQIRIIDLLGVTHKLIQVNNGYNDVTLLKGDLPSSGIYFCILEANNEIIDKVKFISLR